MEDSDMKTHQFQLPLPLVLFLLIFSPPLLAAAGLQSGEMMRGHGMGMMDREQMRDHMREMNEMMARIHRSDDPEERARLMREHMEMMGKGMAGMRGMMGKGMGMSPEQRQQMMEERMDMMQEMMEQMMEHMMARHGAERPMDRERERGREHRR
jgi:periplasmic protein CpxP/Spy